MIKTTDYIYTHSGRRILPYDPNPDDIILDDIIYGLASIYRFNGQTRISVLRHSLALTAWVSTAIPTSLEARHYALMHDAAEAYLMDVPVPMKRYMNSSWAEDMRRIESIILKKFVGTDAPISQSIVDAMDKKLVEYEMDSRACTNEPGSRMRYPLSRTVTLDFDDHYAWSASDAELMPLFHYMHGMYERERGLLARPSSRKPSADQDS